MQETIPFDLETILPLSKALTLEKDKKTLIYNYYNLDPYWYKDQDVQRVLLLEPSFFTENPVSQKCLDFALELAKNIMGIQVFVGEFSELSSQVIEENIIYKEHPTNSHYLGKEEAREWLSDVSGYYPSFFAFWRKCKKQIDFKSA